MDILLLRKHIKSYVKRIKNLDELQKQDIIEREERTKFYQSWTKERLLKIDDENVVGFWRGLLGEVNKEKPLKDDIDFLANLIAYIGVFLPLRGWNLKARPTKKSIDSIIDFILRGLGLK